MTQKCEAPTTGATGSYCLKQSALGETHRSRASDDEVIEDLDVDKRERLFERLRKELVCPTRLRYAGGVVVGEDDGGRVVRERRLDHLARVHAGLGEGAAEQLVARDDAVLRVHEHDDEDFVPS